VTEIGVNFSGNKREQVKRSIGLAWLELEVKAKLENGSLLLTLILRSIRINKQHPPPKNVERELKSWKKLTFTTPTHTIHFSNQRDQSYPSDKFLLESNAN
jgi:hypothetical protein